MPGLLLALLLAAAPANAVAGTYAIRQMEMAGGLDLRTDGRFRYALEYGAVSEEGGGKWRLDGPFVLLTSDPMPRAPDFTVVRDDPAPHGELTIGLTPPGFASTGLHPDILIKANGRPDLYELELDEGGRGTLPADVTAIVPRVPGYGDLGTPIRLSPGRGHKLLLRFVPNDLGKARFDGEKLARDGDALVLYRYDAKIVFQPRPR